MAVGAWASTPAGLAKMHFGRFRLSLSPGSIPVGLALARVGETTGNLLDLPAAVADKRRLTQGNVKRLHLTYYKQRQQMLPGQPKRGAWRRAHVGSTL